MQEGEKIDLIECFYIFQRRLKLIVAITLSITLITVIFSYFIIKPVYESRMSIIIGKATNNNGNSSYNINDVTMYIKAVQTYVEIAKSEDVAERAQEILEGKFSTEELKDMLSVIPQSDTQIMEIVVRTNNREEAKVIVTAFTQAFKENAQKLIPNGSIEVFQNPKVPKKPVKPNKEMNTILGFIIGVAISLATTLIMELLDNTIKSKDEVERYTELSVMGIIPKYLGILNRKSLIVVRNKPNSIVAEAFRTLRTNIIYSSIDQEINTILITSAGPSEGKTSVVSNFAYTIANSEKKVLVIDCDLRKPNIHKQFRVSNSIGLSDILAGQVNIEDAIHECEKNLYVLTSGKIPPNPSEILSSRKMKEFIDKIKGDFQYVIFDTPPIIAVTDAQALANKVDGVIIVVAAKETEKDALIRANELLVKVRANILGIVMNKIEFNRGKNYGYKYQSYYSYGNKSNNKFSGSRKKRRIERMKNSNKRKRRRRSN
ncbi:hypothetical protein SH2C18_01600 [Clostridium sediminicola]|uniref:polysaccharide biosynthesis tyrosine autokinase n=1 Tax=Clostridium sediminicola TaxID=3114879 RepID=UPI0031F1D04C